MAARTLLSTAIGRKAQIHDSFWKTLKRHAMLQIKALSSLFSFVKAVSKAERPLLNNKRTPSRFLY
jgi:hypothetical protein